MEDVMVEHEFDPDNPTMVDLFALLATFSAAIGPDQALRILVDTFVDYLKLIAREDAREDEVLAAAADKKVALGSASKEEPVEFMDPFG